MCVRCRWQLQKGVDRVQARARMQVDVRWINRGAHNLLGGVTSAGWLSLLPASSNRLHISVRFLRRKRSRSRSKIAHKLTPACSPDLRARGTCARPGLRRRCVGCRQPPTASLERRLGRCYRDNPLSMEMRSKEALFYSAGRSHGKGASQCMRSFRKFGIDGRYIQTAISLPSTPKHRRAGAA